MKIVIVEDEIRIREGIEKLLSKFFSECEIVGTAKNGEQGLTLISSTQPDLVITDIKMPIMNGLDMIENVVNKGISTKFIVLSAYEEFSYAQRALKWGVSEYLTKPLDINELLNAVENVKKSIAIDMSNTPDVFGQIENILFGAIFGELQIDNEIIKYLDVKYNIENNAKIIEIQVYCGDDYDDNIDKNIKLASSLLNERDDIEYCFLQSQQERMLIIIIYKYKERSELERWIQQKLLRISKVSKNYGSCGIIEIHKINEIKKSHQLLQQHMDWNISFGYEVLISYPKILQVQTTLCVYPLDIENQLKTAICSYNFDKTLTTVKSFKNYFENGKIYQPKEIKENYIRFIWSMIGTAKEIDLICFGEIDQKAILNSIMQATSQEELTKVLLKCTDIICNNKVTENEGLSNNIKRAIRIIKENYQLGITLDEIASRLNLTPEYLGMQFHKEMCVKFSTYIKDYRINKAKELLIGTNLKVMDIATKVGYSEPKYFSKVFKEATGQLPAEYRKNNG